MKVAILGSLLLAFCVFGNCSPLISADQSKSDPATAEPAKANSKAEKPADEKPAKPIRALLITGGCCHDYEKQKKILSEGVSSRANVEWTIVHEGGSKSDHKVSIYSNPDWAKGYDVVVHNECFAGVNDEAFINGILKAHRDGVPAVNLHCAMHCYRPKGFQGWFEMLGLQSSGHGPQTPIEITYVKKDHPITKALDDWTTINEELYNNHKIHDTATPLARGKQGKEDVVVTWINDYHGTRIFCTTIGHNNATIADARYLDLVTAGLLWSVDKLDAKHVKPAKPSETKSANESK